MSRHRADPISCDVCGGDLEPSEYGGYMHADDENDDHDPVVPTLPEQIDADGLPPVTEDDGAQ